MAILKTFLAVFLAVGIYHSRSLFARLQQGSTTQNSGNMLKAPQRRPRSV
jgi:hypothetical protein